MKTTKLLLVTTSLTCAAATYAEVTELTAVSWGGAYQASQQKAYTEPYAEMKGINFIWDESSAEAVNKLRAMAESGNITWDIVDVEAPDAIRLCDEGLARPIDVDTELADGDDGSKASEDFGEMLVSECFIPQIVFSTTWAVRNDVAEWNGAMPEGICDVFDTEAFPGKRAILPGANNNMEWASYCAGNEDVYAALETEEGQQAALEMWSSIKDDLIFAGSAADVPQMLADGEVVMGSSYNGRLFSLIVENGQENVEMLWDAQIYQLDGWIIPANLDPEREAAVLEFVKFATDTQRLADQAKYISYGPARASSAPLVGQHADLGVDMAPHMPTDPANSENTILADIGFWADYRDDIDTKWEAWKAQ